MNVSENNRRIAKNTLVLYARMAFTMCLGVFTTRVLLGALGVTDYGLVNVLAGVVSMFGFLSGTMSTACSRFFNFELGRKDFVRLKQTFNLTQLIYVGLVVVLLLLSETVGLWFFENKVVVPPERADAAFWFFQFSVFTFLLSTLSIPYSSLIVSHENMKAFAWITIFEASARLGIIYLLSLSSFDRLAFYGALMMLVGVVHFSLNWLVCRRSYAESRTGFFWEKKRFVELVAFGGWNLWGAMSGLFTNVFINVLLNNYFGSAVNAARAVAQQVSGAVTSFTQNFLTATNPQIVKYYAAGEISQSHLLTMRASRMGFFLLFFIALPAWLLMPFVLELWLDPVPAHALWFTRLILIQVLIDAFSYPLMTQAQASGKVALYQSVVGGVLWLTLPIAWVALRFFAAPPESVACVSIGISCVCLWLRLILIRRCAKLSVRAFVKKTLVPAGLAACAAAVVPAALARFVVPAPGWTQFFVVGFACVFCTVPAIAFLGFTRDERDSIFRLVRSRLEKRRLRR
ncbi:MAG: lipopolysaccharide biosynthesis protein [Candidatus Spyradosoma sp.]